MSKKKDIRISTKRLEQLKQATIINYLAYIDLDNDLDLYDVMIHLFIDGKLDDAFYSPMFDNMEKRDKYDLLELGREYASLCFFGGNPSYWTDSIEGLSLKDYDLICMRLLDNFNYMLEIARDGGVEALEQLKRFQNTKLFSDNIVIDYLRGIFDDDELLKQAIIDVSKKDGDYQGFSDIQKAIMFVYPDGVLYEGEGEGKKRLPISKLMEKVDEKISSNKSYSPMIFPSFNQSLKDSLFEEIITDIYMDYSLNDLNNLINKNDDKKVR